MLPSVETHLLRYVFPGTLVRAETPEALFGCFERNLLVRGMRTKFGHTYETVFDLLLRFGGVRPPNRESQQLAHLSDLSLFLEYMPASRFPRLDDAYAPKPEATAEVEKLFEEAKESPYRDMDAGPEGEVTKVWKKFVEKGKPALHHFCRRFPEAGWLPDRTGWGDVMRGCVEAVDGRVSSLVDGQEYSAVAAALRVRPNPAWGAGELPRGLLQDFALVLDGLEKSIDIPNPGGWWEKNEALVPDA